MKRGRPFPIGAAVAGWLFCNMLALPTGAAFAETPPKTCVSKFSATDVHLRIDAAERVYVDMEEDPAPFGLAVAEASQAWECLNERAQPELAARIHRIKGLHRFVNGDDDAARRAFAAARALDPNFRYPSNIQPTDPAEPFNLIWFGMPADPVPRGTLPTIDPKAGALWFDGGKTMDRPVDRPTVAQHIGPEGEVQRTEYLRMDQTMFDYPVLKERDRSAAWWTGGIGLGALAIAGGSGVYYASIIRRAECETANGEYSCSNINTSTEEFDTTFVRPTKIVGFTALGIGGALIATSGVLFTVDNTGASVSVGRRW
jgi:hypothetical protein